MSERRRTRRRQIIRAGVSESHALPLGKKGKPDVRTGRRAAGQMGR